MTRFRLLSLIVFAGLALLGWAYATALADPVVRQAQVALPGYPANTPPVTVALISDIHVAGPDMPPERLARIVEQVNALKPDIVLIAGDFVSDKFVSTHKYSFAQAVEPLAQLRTRLGTFAVLGNHDFWRNEAEARRSLQAVGLRVLDNDAARVGPIALGGLDDAFTGHDDLALTLARMRLLGGASVLLSHSPDPFPAVPHDVPLMLAGHTHCGQIVLPLIGPIATMSRYGTRYACGVIRENGKTLVVGAGVGTSLLPLRLGAAPDIWLLTLTSTRH
ncbi:MAG: metallophosphoesterase [Sphingomonadales bacterium]